MPILAPSILVALGLHRLVLGLFGLLWLEPAFGPRQDIAQGFSCEIYSTFHLSRPHLNTGLVFHPLKKVECGLFQVSSF